MTAFRIINSYKKLSDANLLAKANTIKEAMTDNPHFSTPTPDLATLQTAITAFEDSLSVAKNGSNYDKAVKNQKRNVLIDLLHSLGAYVLFTANGDVLVAKSSGFGIAKAATPSILQKPVNLQLKDGMNPGELALTFNRVGGAKGFVYQYTTDPGLAEGSWQMTIGTSCKIVLSGLESGKRHFVRVVAMGSLGQKSVSDMVSRLVQ